MHAKCGGRVRHASTGQAKRVSFINLHHCKHACKVFQTSYLDGEANRLQAFYDCTKNPLTVLCKLIQAAQEVQMTSTLSSVIQA